MALQVTIQRRFALDPQRVADTLASRLLDDYSGEDIDKLSRDGVRKFARQRYVTLCTVFGLPSAATDAVVEATWARVAEAQGIDKDTGDKAFTFYD